MDIRQLYLFFKSGRLHESDTELEVSYKCMQVLQEKVSMKVHL